MSTDLEKANIELEKRFNRQITTSLSNLCTHCGWCADSCHIYLATGDPAMTPVAKAERVRRVYKKSHDWLSKIFPFWTGARKLTEEELDDWVETSFLGCTLCERCTVNCPMGVENGAIMGAARSTLTAVGKAPEILGMLADSAITKEESMEFYRDFFLEQVAEMEKDVQEKLGDPTATIPVDKQDAEFLFVPLAGGHTIIPPAIIFNAVGASWTMSMFEASNYAVFLGDTEKAKRITERIIREAERLNIKEVVLAECGHAYTTLKWEAPKWFGKELPFRVRSILEVLDEFISDGRLKVDPSLNPDPVTYHDSCNLGRKGGLFEEPRRVMKAISQDYREMTPNRLQNFCCGGGSGVVAIDEWNEARINTGKPKAEQIRETGVKTVVTSCDNCRHQIIELNEHFGLDINVSSLTEMTVNALVVPERVALDTAAVDQPD
ncbi:(Fe-S)-binding protein [Chloroflexota bacterium]